MARRRGSCGSEVARERGGGRGADGVDVGMGKSAGKVRKGGGTKGGVRKGGGVEGWPSLGTSLPRAAHEP